MPAPPRHDENLPGLDHRLFSPAFAIDAGDEAAFEDVEYFITCRMTFPVVGMYRIIIEEVDDSEQAVDAGVAKLSPGTLDPSSPSVSAVCDQVAVQEEG